MTIERMKPTECVVKKRDKIYVNGNAENPKQMNITKAGCNCSTFDQPFSRNIKMVAHVIKMVMTYVQKSKRNVENQ